MGKTTGSKRELSDKNKDESPPKKIKVNKINKFKDEYDVILQEKLGVNLPEDFFSFYEFIQNEMEMDILPLVGLYLTGPYDIVLGKINKDKKLTKSEVFMHGRHYYDTPEIMTVLHTKNNSGFHIAYFRDDPKDLPNLLVSNKSKVNGEFSPCGDNIFAAVYIFCISLLKSTKDPTKSKKINALCKSLEKKGKESGYVLEAMPPSVKKRQKLINSRTFSKIGIVVPMDKTGVGYRELPSTDRELKQILTKIANADTEEKKNKAFDELDEIITLVQFANDECDYGMGLELGINLFIFGHDTLHGTISHLLPLAYQLLGRNLYADVITQHLENRKRDGFLSQIG